MRHRSPLPRIRIAVATTAAITVVAGVVGATALAGPTTAHSVPKPAGAHSTGSGAAGGPATPSVPKPVGTDRGSQSSEFPAARSSALPSTLRGAPLQSIPGTPPAPPAGTKAVATSAAKTTVAAKPGAVGATAITATASAPAVTSCTTADFASRTGSALVAYIKTVDWYSCINPLFGLTGTAANSVFKESQMLAVANGVSAAAPSYPGDDSTGLFELTYFLRAGYYVQSYNSADVPNYDATLTSAVESGLNGFFASAHSNDVSAANGNILEGAVILTDSANVQGDYLSVYKRILGAYTSAWDANSSMDNALNAVYTPLWRGVWNPAFVTAVTADPSIADALSDFALNHLGLLGGNNDVLDSNAGNDLAHLAGIAALQSKVRPLIKGLLHASSITGPTANLWVHVAFQADEADASQCSYYGTCDLTAKLTAASLPISYPCSTFTIMAESLTAQQQTDVCNSLKNEVPYFTNLDKAAGPIPNQTFKVKMVIYGSKRDYATYSWAIFGNSTDNGGETLTGDPTDPNNVAYSILYQWPTANGFTANAWNLNHEFAHVLQSIYDMKGDFGSQIAVNDVWWIEGQAEYVSYTYRGVTDDGAMTEAAKHTYKLSTLFQNNYVVDDTTRTYPWGYLAVRYMFEKHPADIQAMLAKFRTGDYNGAYAVYNGLGTSYDADFDAWLTGLAAGGTPALPACTSTNTQAMDRNCSRANQSASAGNYDYLWIYLPAGTTTLKITTVGGTGNADLYYNPNNWATTSAYTAKSTASGNSETVTVTNTTAGYRYLSLYAKTAFSGVIVSTQY